MFVIGLLIVSGFLSVITGWNPWLVLGGLSAASVPIILIHGAHRQ